MPIKRGRCWVVPNYVLAEGDAEILGVEIVSVINAVRIRGLGERQAKDGKILFKAGDSDIANLIVILPELIRRIQDRVDRSSKFSGSLIDSSTLTNYRNALSKLALLNRSIGKHIGQSRI